MGLRLQTCIIRSWRVTDDLSIARHANNHKVWRNLRDSFPSPYTREDARSWIFRSTAESPHTSFAIEVEGQAAGSIGLVLKHDIHRHSAEIGYWLGEAFWSRGIMSEAVRAFTEYAFSHFDLCRIYAHIFEWNPASARVLEKAGYVLEGRLRKAAVKDGQIIDQLIYAIVR